MPFLRRRAPCQRTTLPRQLLVLRWPFLQQQTRYHQLAQPSSLDYTRWTALGQHELHLLLPTLAPLEAQLLLATGAQLVAAAALSLSIRYQRRLHPRGRTLV